jgi:hypothetical protein
MEKTRMISLPVSMNELGLEEQDLLSRILQTPTIALALFLGQKSFPSGVFNVGYVYDGKLETKYLKVC